MNKNIEDTIADYSKMFFLHKDDVSDLYKSLLKYYRGKGECNWADMMKNTWYKHLREEELARMDLYDNEYYVCDVLACYTIYSKNYIKMIANVIDKNDIKKVGDLGCGVGLTTKDLSEQFSADVTGTNLNGPQYEFCKGRIDVVLDHRDLGIVDMIFASEYFEHIPCAGDHLFDIIEFNQPKYIVMANAFNSESFGHFDKFYNGNYMSNTYHCDSMILSHQMGRMFAGILKCQNYKQMKTRFWNNRPSVWVRDD